MNNIVLLLFVVLFSSCTEEKFFLDFDEVDHYSMDKQYFDNFHNRLLQKEDVGYEETIYSDFPKVLNDSVFLTLINSNKFRKKIISEANIEKLKNTIFVKNTSFFREAYACAPIYRDILILKNKNKIVGIAKICMECKKYYFVGNQKNIETEDFGQNGEFDEIKEIFDDSKTK
jgi:hypothetical protein